MEKICEARRVCCGGEEEALIQTRGQSTRCQVGDQRTEHEEIDGIKWKQPTQRNANGNDWLCETHENTPFIYLG